MKNQSYIACDLGAESGRVMLGTLADGRLALEEVHRFPNRAVKIQGTLRWDILGTFEELKTGLRKVAARGIPIRSLSVDSWGVDYVLFNARQPLLALPYHYRDARTDRTYSRALKVCVEEIYAETGIQFMAINTLYHLIAEVEENPEVVGIADQFLNIADYFNYLFSGVAANEVSSASTTQLYNPLTGSWSARLIKMFGLPEKLFPKIVPAGTRLGPLLDDVSSETGLSGVEVIATCSHDTGAAVAAVPAEGAGWAYLSSGTWSLIGVELLSPLINHAVRQRNFTNEAGYGGTTRFLKNIAGLWLLQECRRAWTSDGRSMEYAGITRAAEDAEPFRSLIKPNNPDFVRPANMPAEIAHYCRRTNQPVPETPGQFARCILESLALSYRAALDEIEQLTGQPVNRLHIVGGGSQSALLNQFAANATGRAVFAGPVEATAIGNVLIQAITTGDLNSLVFLRRVVKASFPIQSYQPASSKQWTHAFDRFNAL